MAAIHAQAGGGLPLAGIDLGDGGAQRLAGVGGRVEREPDDGGRQGIELQADLGQAVVDDEELHQQRRATKERDVEAYKPLDGTARIQPTQGQQESQQQAEEHPAQAEQHGEARAAQQIGQGFEDERQGFGHAGGRVSVRWSRRCRTTCWTAWSGCRRHAASPAPGRWPGAGFHRTCGWEYRRSGARRPGRPGQSGSCSA